MNKKIQSIFYNAFLLVDDPATTAVGAGTAVAEDIKTIIASILGGGSSSSNNVAVDQQQLPIPITQIILIFQFSLAVALRYVLIIPYIFLYFLHVFIWGQNDLTCPADVIKQLFFFNPVEIYTKCMTSPLPPLPEIPIPSP